MSALEQKMESRRKGAIASDAVRIAGDIEAKQMAAPDLKGRIKKWIAEEVAAAMAKNDEKLIGAITAAVKIEVTSYCKDIFPGDEEYYAVAAEEDG